jgi:hypothetical protein
MEETPKVKRATEEEPESTTKRAKTEEAESDEQEGEAAPAEAPPADLADLAAEEQSVKEPPAKRIRTKNVQAPKKVPAPKKPKGMSPVDWAAKIGKPPALPAGGEEVHPGVFLFENWVQQAGLDDNAIFDEIMAIPMHGMGKIPFHPNVPCVIPGKHSVFNYRNKKQGIPRDKFFGQLMPVRKGYLKYFYTGYKYKLVAAKKHISKRRLPRCRGVLDELNKRLNLRYNDAIFTRYPDGSYSIPDHADKMCDIDENSYIGVLRLGMARVWRLVDNVSKQVVWQRNVGSGSLLLASIKSANNSWSKLPQLTPIRMGLSQRIAASIISPNCRSFLSPLPTFPGLIRYLERDFAQSGKSVSNRCPLK